ncbi:MAG: ATP-grasp domain-containing protein [Raoultibacter sp.]|jgi:hypothetical protein
MFVLDDFYVSDEVLDYLENSQEPVFDNAAARSCSQGRSLNMQSQPLSPEERICALSEIHLEDIKRFAHEDTVRGIELFKDKAACRRALTPLFPHYVFEEYNLESLQAQNPESVKYPVVIKPATGFFSVGIYPVFTEEQWRAAVADIAASSSAWHEGYSKSVVNDASFLVESYIDGEEYAIDAYFDAEGHPVVLNILRHDFAGNDDVSDRLYYTSKTILTENMCAVRAFLEAANQEFKLRNFPFHVEVRINESDGIVPIEFNPLRFAGLCTTDVAYFAYGFKTYACFFEDKRPDWESILSQKDDELYTMILLTKPGFEANRAYSFNYDALAAHFQKVLALRKTDFKKLNTFGMLFTETPMSKWNQEIEPILSSSLDEYISLTS